MLVTDNGQTWRWSMPLALQGQSATGAGTALLPAPPPALQGAPCSIRPSKHCCILSRCCASLPGEGSPNLFLSWD